MKKFLIAVSLLGGLSACANEMAQPAPAPAAPPQAAAPAAPAVRMASATGANVRVHRTASTRSPTIARLALNAQVQVVNSNAEWTEIRTQNGQTGFVVTRLLRMS